MKMQRIRIFLFVMILAAFSPAWAEDFQSELEEFRKFAVRQMKEDQIPALTIGFVQWGNGEPTQWVEAFGYSDLENQVPAKADTAYRLASVSKPLTAAAALLLAERGKMDLDAEVQTYVPYFPKKQWPVTARQLMGHIGGISHYKNYELEGRIKEHKNTREAIAIFETFDLVAEPGTKFSYSSYGYNLLAAVVEGASGMAFGEFMKQNIWGPMRMDATRLDDPSELIPNRARGYRILNKQIANSEFVDISSRMGGGGTRSTVPDLLKFAKGIAEGKLLKPQSMDLIETSMTTRDGHFTGYSTGWDTDPMNGHFMLRHSGSQQETATILLLFPWLKLAIAAAVNQEDAGATIFARRLFELLKRERWAATAYASDHKHVSLAVESVFDAGMSYYEDHGQAVTQDSAELKKSFEYFSRSVDAPDIARKLIPQGTHPASGQPFTKLGSFMASELAKSSGTRVEQYHQYGAIPFFADYIRATGGKKTVATLPKSFRKLISQWEQSWKKTNSDETRMLDIHAETDFQQLGSQLRSAFRSQPVYPDYSRKLGDIAWSFLLKGADEKSLKTGSLGVSLYPDSARLIGMHGISQVALSQTAEGEAALRKSFLLDPDGPAEPDYLSDFAEELAYYGRTTEAVRVLQSAITLHPGNAELLSDMGEAQLAMNDRAKAREFFEKALAMDPKLERAKTMLESMSQ